VSRPGGNFGGATSGSAVRSPRRGHCATARSPPISPAWWDDSRTVRWMRTVLATLGGDARQERDENPHEGLLRKNNQKEDYCDAVMRPKTKYVHLSARGPLLEYTSHVPSLRKKCLPPHGGGRKWEKCCTARKGAVHELVRRSLFHSR